MPEEEQQIVETIPKRTNNLNIPVAIVIAATIIAGAIYFGGNTSSRDQVKIPSPDEIEKQQVTADVEIAPVTKDDHIRGNPNATVLIVEYSDFDCPFCKSFHETMNKIIGEYGKNGDVAWVYRHFPIEQLHKNSPKIAEASECVAELAGNDGFWKFTDFAFGERSINAPTDLSRITEFAVSSGADKSKFELCYNSGKYTEKIKSDIISATKTGAQGTPYSIMMVGNEHGPINGAQPYNTVKEMIDIVLSQVSGGAQ